VLLIALACLAPVAPLHAQSPPPIIDPDSTSSTKIAPHCVLTVVVADEPELSGAFPVDAEGRIQFTIADNEGGNKTVWYVSVQGKTPEEARAAVTESLKTYLLEPAVKIYLTKLARVTVDVHGPAKVNGKLELPVGARLSDAMGRCGYRPDADIANVRILRRESVAGKPVSRTIAVDFSAFARGESDVDPKLETGDKIVLPMIPVQTHVEPKLMRVDGEVQRQSSIPVAAGMTVRDAFERAGGLKETADRDSIHMVRADGRILELHADKIDANDPTQNLVLAGGDLIIVGRADRSERYAVMGEVLHPGTFVWNPKEKLSVLRVLDKVGGLTKNADMKHGMLRKGFFLNPTHTVDVYFDLTQMLKGKQQDWEVEAGDAVIIQKKPRQPNLLMQILPIALRFLPL
jgi:protein involved in polysaccharide export with SLBB domain